MKPKDIFGLAVRLLGLYFLYSGLNDFALALGTGVFEDTSSKDIFYSLLPELFKLVVSVWLLSGWPLIRLVYPEKPHVSENLSSLPKRPAPSPGPATSPEPAGMDQAEKKLAALVEKPKEK